MKKIFLFTTILSLFFTTVNAQGENQQVIDSVQRKLMKDSLQTSGEIVAQIFTIRNSMAEEITRLRRATTFESEIIDEQIASVRNAANDNIKQILGDQKYLQYTQMIRRWVNRRTNQNNDPLAADNQ